MSNQLEQVLLQLVEHVKDAQLQFQMNKIPVADRLWSTKEIAEYLLLSEHTVSQKIVVQPSFPTPTQPTASKRWFAGEVITWARQHKSRLPVGRRRAA